MPMHTAILVITQLLDGFTRFVDSTIISVHVIGVYV